MAEVLAYKRNRNGPGTRELPVSHQTEIAPVRMHALDSEESRSQLRQLLEWYYYERDRQAENRLEMAIDHDFYDGDQWSPEDAATLEERKQMALVYNEVAPMCDWLIGTERRAPVDWNVLPRTEDDVESANVKTQVLKYVADINRVQHNRSRAFADAIKGGIGWVDDGVRDDPTQDPLYSRYEDWRCILMDSSGLDLTGDDARYIFRWRWVDEDVALMMFPDRADKIKSAVEDASYHDDPMDAELDWQTSMDDGAIGGRSGTFAPISGGTIMADAKRRRVKLIECQFRKPVKAKFIASGPLRGAMFDPRDKALVGALNTHGGTIIDKVTMRVHCAVMTESALLSLGPAIYRHNKFSLTPLVCYRKGRTRQWYGTIRRVRGVQQDLNKRASKALWLLNTNQVIADKDAFDDPEAMREEIANPDAMVLKKTGTEVRIQRDTDGATGQLQIMSLAATSIQRGSGVTDENMGRKTNAVSGAAITARQTQGSVVTTEPFDNERLAVQCQGEKQLSLIEQFYSEEKVLRLTGKTGKIDWLRINQPEVQPDGSVRWINDITASMADFIVDEADYAGTLRQVMFESMTQLSQRLPPEIALKLLRMAYEYSDLPNKDEIADEIRRMTGEQDPNKKMTPEEEAQAQQQAQAQAEAMQLQRETAVAALETQQAKAREIAARAEKIMAEVEQLRTGGGTDMQDKIERAVGQVREQAAQEIDALSAKLTKAVNSNAADLLKIRSDADTATEVARIGAASRVYVAELQQASDTALGKLNGRIDSLAQIMGELQRGAEGPAESKTDATPD